MSGLNKEIAPMVAEELRRYIPNLVEVKHGRWIKQPNGEYKCSICGDTTLVPLYECHTCGAYMQEVEE